MNHRTSLNPQTRLKEALIRGAIWAFIGLLYAMLFVILAGFSEHWHLPIAPYLFAGVLAGTLGALIYSSMRLSVLMTIIIAPISLFYFMFSEKPVNMPVLLLVVTAVGAFIGALYGFFSLGSRVYRADAKTLAGFSAGWLAALGYLLLSGITGAQPVSLVVAVMCPITGIIYVLLVPSFIRMYDNLLPPVGDGLMAGIGVSGFISLSLFIMTSSIDTDMAGPLLPTLDWIHAQMGGAIVGGILGGGLAGVLSGLLLTDWQDL
ncbi:MAG: hypothetical protein ABW068_09475 [Candidatus Thiodiazotropha sp.]